MSEVEAIKARANGRKSRMRDVDPRNAPPHGLSFECGEAERDLERAIAIAELSDAALDGFAIQVERLTEERDEARQLAEEKQIAFNLMMDERVGVSTGELQQARADVLKLRDAMNRCGEEGGCRCDFQPLLSTASYEAYR